MEQQRTSIDEHNKQYYELTKAKDQCQATRKEQFVYYVVFFIIKEFLQSISKIFVVDIDKRVYYNSIYLD